MFLEGCSVASSALLSVKFFLSREDFLCLSFVIFVTFVVRGLLSLGASQLFLMVRFGFCSSSARFSGFLFLSSASSVPLRFKGLGFRFWLRLRRAVALRGNRSLIL